MSQGSKAQIYDLLGTLTDLTLYLRGQRWEVEGKDGCTTRGHVYTVQAAVRGTLGPVRFHNALKVTAERVKAICGDLARTFYSYGRL